MGDSAIQQALNSILALMLAKFLLNDVPHTAGLFSGSAYFPAAVVYHITPLENLDGILKGGLVRGNQYVFFLHNYRVAYNQAKSMAEEGDGYALLKIILTPEDVNRCEVGEMFPDLYTEKFGTEPPLDVPMHEFMEHPREFMIAEVACEIDRVQPERIAVVRKFGVLR